MSAPRCARSHVLITPPPFACRHKIQALVHFLGQPNLWLTITPDDVTSLAVRNHVTMHRHTPTDPVALANMINANAGACAYQHDQIMKIVIEEILTGKTKHRVTGGLFGKCVGYAGMNETQQRGQGHAHFNGWAEGFPCTTTALLVALQDPNFVKDLLHFAETSQRASHYVTHDEFLSAANSNHDCPTLNDDHSAISGVPPATLETFPVPLNYALLTEPRPNLPHPSNTFCTTHGCNHSTSSHELIWRWALANAAPAVAAAHRGGDERLQSVDIDVEALDLPQHELRNVQARAAMTLLSLAVLEHDPGHRKGCFPKSSSSGAPRTCRYRRPQLVFEATVLLVNGRTVCSCGDCDACSAPDVHVAVSALVESVDDLRSVEIVVKRDAGSEYLSEHPTIVFGNFKCNVNFRATCGNAAAAFYTTSYSAKLPESKDTSTRMLSSLQASIRRTADKDPHSRGRSAAFSLLHSSTSTMEVPIIEAALYLLRADPDQGIHYYSHDFATVSLQALITRFNGETPLVTFSPTKKKGAAHLPAMNMITNTILDYEHRDADLFDFSYYDFVSSYHRVPGAPNPKNTNHAALNCAHPLAATHRLVKRKRPAVPLLSGRRLPDPRGLDFADHADPAVVRYSTLAMALYRPWNHATPFGPDHVEQYSQWDQSDSARHYLHHHADYYLSKRVAQSSASTSASAAFPSMTFVVDDDDAFGTLELSQHHDSALDAVVQADVERANKLADAALVAPTRNLPHSLKAWLCTLPDLTAPNATTDLSHVLTAMRLDPLTATPNSKSLSAPPPAHAPPTVAQTHVSHTAAHTFALLMKQTLLQSMTLDAATAPSRVTPDTVTLPNMATVQETIDLYQFDRVQSQPLVIAAAVLLRHRSGLKVTSPATTEQHVLPDLRRLLRAMGLNHADVCAQVIKYVGGQGGTGKSRIIAAIAALAESWGMQRQCPVTALTGDAAVNVHGCTLHSYAGLSVGGGAQHAKDDVLDRIKSTALLIVDEISLMSCGLNGQLNSALRHATGIDLPYGGINVFLTGDKLQLDPVGAPLHCLDPANASSTLLENNRQNRQHLAARNEAGRLIWQHHMTHATILEKNYRAAKDPDYSAFLKTLREDRTISVAHHAKLNRRRLSATLSAPPDAIHVYYTNKNVLATNMNVVHLAAAALSQQLYRIHNVVTPEDQPPLPRNHPSLQGYFIGVPSGSADAKTKPMPYLDFYVGMPVVIQPGNKNNHLGVANGSEARVVGTVPPLPHLASQSVQQIVTLPSGHATTVHNLPAMPDAVLVYNPNFNVHFPGLPPGVLPIPLQTTKKMRFHGVLQHCTVNHFKIRHCFAKTCHLLQGTTLPALVLGETVPTVDNWNYTALSRVATWEDLFLLPNINTLKLIQRTPLSAELLHDLQRLQTLSDATAAAITFPYKVAAH